MPTSPMASVIEHLRKSVLLRDEAGLRDGELLGSFIERHDEVALAALIQRHGPMVWGVCRRLLGHHDAEDAFQATFLVLARKAASVVPRAMVGIWLYGVAHRTALQARRTAARRRAREVQVTVMPATEAVPPDRWADVQPLLDQELSCLPDNYRAVLLLCDLEGRTRKEVARQLRVPQGTVAGRLARARVMLAKRLAARGVTLSGGALAAVLAQNVASAGVPIAVMSYTIKTTGLFALGKAAAAGMISPKVAALTKGVLRAMLLSKLKVVMVLVVIAALGGVAGLIHHTPAAEPPKDQAATRSADRPEQPAKNRKPKPDEEQLRGTWKLVKAEENGKSGTLRDGDLGGTAVFAVRGETLHMKVTEDGKNGLPIMDRFFVFRLDTTTTPKLIDLADWHEGFANNSKVLEGVYSLDGNTLTICFADGCFGENSEKSRPTTLRSKEGSNTTVWWLEKEAEAKKPGEPAAPGPGAAPAGAGDKKTKETAATAELDGSYTVVEAISTEKKRPGFPTTPVGFIRKCRVAIKDGVISFVQGDPDVDGDRADVKFTLDPSKDPGRIDLKPLPPEGSEWADPSLTLPGIYRVKKTDQGLELTIAWMASPQGQRPQKFDGKAPAEVVVRLLRKGK
jgi:RNA polymerase sigma factor (sigma-70 family)